MRKNKGNPTLSRQVLPISPSPPYPPNSSSLSLSQAVSFAGNSASYVSMHTRRNVDLRNLSVTKSTSGGHSKVHEKTATWRCFAIPSFPYARPCFSFYPPSQNFRTCRTQCEHHRTGLFYGVNELISMLKFTFKSTLSISICESTSNIDVTSFQESRRSCRRAFPFPGQCGIKLIIF